MRDPLELPVDAFVAGPRVVREPTGRGVLDGLTCAVKDAFDVAGAPTGYGNPTWRSTHAVPERDADAVAAIRAHGARVVGKTLTDELAFSLAGNNHHDGSPVNPAAPDRRTGGSSCGSASAVAAGLCDIALGTDTGGSVRAPASFCGLFGIRPTHDAVSRRGVCELAPSCDTVGWFARDARTLAAVGEALLPADTSTTTSRDWAWFDAAWEVLPAEVGSAVAAHRARLAATLGRCRPVPVDLATLDRWFEAFRTVQFYEVWRALGPWITREQPMLGPDVAARMQAARALTRDDFDAASRVRAEVRATFDALLGSVAVIAMPTVPAPAPLRTAGLDDLDRQRRAAMRLLCIASLAGVPQVAMPGFTVEGAPLGGSLMGARGTDRALLALAAELGGAR